MVKGYIISKWTEDQGLIPVLNEPKDLEIDLDDMMRVLYAHITGAGEAGNVLVRLEKVNSNVASYFTGLESETPYMVNLMLEIDEDPEMFGERVLQDINEVILSHLNDMGEQVSQTYDAFNKLKDYLKNALFLLERLKNMTKEQKLAQIYTSKKGKTILDLLQEKALSRKKLRQTLEDKMGNLIVNIEYILDTFYKTELLKQDWIEGLSDVFLFLLKDFTIMRTPPENLIKNARNDKPKPELAEQYLMRLDYFFSKYEPNEEDNRKIAEILVNPDKFDFISIFREKPYPLKKVPKGGGLTYQNEKELIKELVRDNMITIIKDSQNIEWVFLLTDITIRTFFPEYLLENIRKHSLDKTLKKDVAVKHLELLEKTYSK